MFTFVITNESHTLGNIISTYINDHDLAQFSSYRVPHPLCPDVHISIKADTLCEAKQVFIRTCDALQHELHAVLNAINPAPKPFTAALPASFISVFEGATIRDCDMC